MKLLSVLFLTGLALCYAVPHQETRELSVDEVQELDLFLGEVLEEERSTRDLKQNIKDEFDRHMENIAKLAEKGEKVKDDIVHRLKILVKRMIANGIDLEGIKEKINERCGRLPEKLRDTWKYFWGQLNLGPIEYAEGERSASHLKESLKNVFDILMEKVAEVTEKGKDVNSGLMENVKNMVQILKDKGIDLEGIKDRIKERGERLQEKCRDAWKNFWEKLGMGSKEYAEGERSSRNLKDNMKNLFDRLMEKVAEATEKGKEVNGGLMERVRNVVDKLKSKGINLDRIKEKIRERGVGLPVKFKDAWKNFWEKLGMGSSEFAEGERSTRDPKETLSNMFDRLLEMVTKSVEKRKEISQQLADRIKDLLERAKKLGMDFREKLTERSGRLSEEARKLYKEFLKKIGIVEEDDELADFEEFAEFAEEDDDVKTELGKSLREHLNGILQLIRESIERGDAVKDETLKKLKDIRDKMKELRVELGLRAKELLQRIRERGRDYWQKIKDIFGGKNRQERDADEETKERFGKILNKLIERLRRFLEKGREIRQSIVDRVKDMLQKMKDMGMGESDIDGKFRSLMEKLSEKGKESLRNLLEKLGIKRDERMIEFADEEGGEGDEDVKERMGNILQTFLDKIKNVLESRKGISQRLVDRMKEMLRKIKNFGLSESDIIKRFTGLFEKLNDKGKKALDNLMTRLGLKKEERMIELADDGDDDAVNKIKERFRRSIKDLLQKFRNLFNSNKDVREKVVEKIREAIKKVKDLGMEESEITGIFSSMYERLTKVGKGALDRLMTRLGLKKEENMILFADDGNEDEGEDDSVKGRLGRILEKFLDKLKNILDNNKGISQRIVDRIKDMIKKMKNVGIGESDIMGKFSDLGKTMTDKGKEALDRLLKRLGLKKEERMIAFADDGNEDEDEDNSVKGRLGRIFKEFLDKLKNVLNNDRGISQRIVDRMKDMIKKMKNLGIGESDIMGKFSDLHKKMTDKGKEALDRLLKRLGLKKEERMIAFADDGEDPKVTKDLREKFEDLIKKIKDALENGRSFRDGLEKLKEIRERLKEMKGKLGGRAKELLEKLREKIKEYFQKLMEKFNGKEERSLKDIYENIKEYLKNLQIDLKERFVNFGEWAKKKFEDGLEKGKDRAETLKKLAREFIDDAKVIGKDVAEQAKGFFKEYKEDLGTIYDRVREKVREIMERED